MAVTVKVLVKGTERSVYPIFAQASEHWCLDLSLYAHYQNFDLYRYSPLFAIVFTPFAIESTSGHLAWILMSYALLLYAGHQFYACFVPQESEGLSRKLLGWFLILMAAGSVRSVWNGQSNTLLIAIVMLGLVMLTRQRWWLGAFLLMATAFIKLWPLALCALLAANYPRKLIVPFCCFAVLFLGLPFLTNDFDSVVSQYIGWWASLVQNKAGRWPGFRDAWTIWENFVGPVNHSYYLAAQITTGLCTLLLTIRLRQLPIGQRIVFIFCLWIAWQLIFGPATERATYSIFAPAFAFAALRNEQRFHWLIYPIGLLFLVFTHGSMERMALAWFPFAEAFIPLSTVLFFVWVVSQPAIPGQLNPNESRSG